MKKTEQYIPPHRFLSEQGANKTAKYIEVSFIFLEAVRKLGLCKGARILCFFIFAGLVLVTGGVHSAAAGTPVVQTFYVPIPEAHIRSWELGLSNNAITDTNVNTVISITATMDGTIIYYDQWEDGYETDISSPVQSTTQIWGDGNITNGAPPGCSVGMVGPPTCVSATNCDCDRINAGRVITLQNSVPSNPRDQGNIFYDAGDKIAATGQLVVTRAGWLTPTGTVLSGATEVVDTRKWATNFTVPIGTNSPNTGAMFSYTALSIMAQNDNTTVTVGASNYTLNQGQTVYIPSVTYGTQISASSPIQVNVLTGDPTQTYEGRWFTLLPQTQWSNSYYCPVASVNATYPGDVIFYNPNASAITVNVAYNGGTATVTVNANSVSAYQMPANSGAHFYTTGTPAPNFFALFTNNYNGGTYEWAAMMLPETSLTPSVVVGWAPGSDGTPPTQNDDVVWVTPVATTTLYVNYSGNPSVGPNTDPYGNKYDVSYSLNALQYQRITNASFTMTGARIYTVDGTKIAAFWGEDASSGVTGSPGMDLGTAVLPFPSLTAYKTAALIGDYNSNGGIDPGELLQYTIRVHNSGIVAITNIVLTDMLDPNVTYVANSTGYSTMQSGPFTPLADNPVGTLPLAGGVTIVASPAQLNPGQDMYITFQVSVANPLKVPGATSLLNTVSATSTSLAQLNVISENFTNIVNSALQQGGLATVKAANPTGTVKPGDTINYTVTVTNTSAATQTGITLNDPLPAGAAYVSKSTTATGHLQKYVKDMFNQLSYSNNDGPQSWNGNWSETDAADGTGSPTAGNVQVMNGVLRLTVTGSSASRQVDLTTGITGQSFTSATFTFDYRTSPAVIATDAVQVQAYGNGHGWTTLPSGTLSGFVGQTSGTQSYDISSYIGADTAVRFTVSSGYSNAGAYFYADNVMIKTNELPTIVAKDNTAAGSNHLASGIPATLVTPADGFALATGESLTVTYGLRVNNPATASRVTNTVTATSTEQSQPASSTTINPVGPGGTVAGFIWLDSIANGSYDSGEPLLSNVRIWLDTNGNGVYDPGVDIQTLTGTNGGYAFTGLLPGTYVVHVDESTLPTGLTIAAGSNPTSPFTVTNQEQFPNVNFGYKNGSAGTAIIGSYVWSDANNNGIQDPGEVGLGGVTMQLATSPGNVLVATTTTNAYGTYLFTNVAPGTYLVKADTANILTGYTPSIGPQSVGSKTSSPLTVTGGGIYVMENFGFYNASTYSISNRVWSDSNNNGTIDPDEPGIQGVTVTLLNAGGNVIATASTDVYGNFTFSGMPNGSYTVTVTDTKGKLAGFGGTTTAALNRQLSVTVLGANVSGTSFGYNAPGQIGYRIWLDSNGNGLQDPGEQGIAGVTVKLYQDTNGNGIFEPGTDQLAATTTSDASGNYSFQVAQAGRYFVSVDSSQASLNGLVLTTTDDQTSSGYQQTVIFYDLFTSDMTANFGFKAPGTGAITGIVWNDANSNQFLDAGEQGISGVTVQLYQDTNGNNIFDPPSDALVATTTTDSSGYYSFQVSQTGKYFVSIDDTQSSLLSKTLTTTDAWPLAPGVQKTVSAPLLNTVYPNNNFGFVTLNSDLSVTKTASPSGSVSPGSTITYTITIANNNASTTQTGITVIDPVPTNTSYVGGSASVTGYTYATANTPSTTDDADTYLRQDRATTNYGAATTMSIEYPAGANTVARRGLVHFTLPALPAWSIINSATMQFNVTTANANISAINLYQVTQAWVETTATWNTYNGGTNNWATAGGDYDNSTLIGSFSPATTGMKTVNATNLNSLVGNWYGGTAQNNGVILIAQSANAANQTAALGARENGTAGNRPQLTVNYSYPASTTKAPTVSYPAGSTLVSSADGFILAPGQTMTVTYQVTVNASLPPGVTQILNEATVSTNQTASKKAFVTNPVTYTTDLQVTKAVQSLDAPCYAGSCKVTYLITLKNVGTGSVSAAGVTDVLPSGLTYSASVPSSGTYTSGTGLWSISTAIASGNSVTLQLTATVQQLGAPIQNCASLATSTPGDANSGNNTSCVSITPTQVILSDFRSYNEKGNVVVTWTTASEINTIGFYLYRLDESTREYKQLNQRLLPGLLTSLQGGAYSLIDHGASIDTNTYILREVENNGKVNSYGPFTVAVGGPNAVRSQTVSSAMKPQTLINNAFAGAQRQATVPAEGITHYTDQYGTTVITNVSASGTIGHSDATDLFSNYTRKPNGVSEARKGRILAERALTTTAVIPKTQSQGSRLKIAVEQEGLYYMDASSIASLWGLSNQQVAGMIKNNLLALSNQGRTIAYLPAKDGAGVFFYGQGIDSMYTKENIYWLDRSAGVQMEHVQGKGPAPAAGNATFTETIHVEDDKYAVLSIFTDPLTDYWFSDFISVSGYPEYDKPTSTITFHTDGLAGTKDPVSIAVNLQGFSSTGVTNEHHVSVSLNGTPIGEDEWEGAVPRKLVLTADQGLLQNGENTLELEGLLDTGVDYSIFYIDSLDITYPRLYEAVNNALLFEGGENKTITVSGFTNRNILVFNITDPLTPTLVAATTIDAVAGLYRVSIASSPGTAQFLAITADAAVSPAYAWARPRLSLASAANKADYVVIAPGKLVTAAQPLADYRQGKGLNAMVIKLEDIMDEFNYGISSPAAIHHFLKYAHTTWKKAPRYVVLAGEGNFDYKDNMGFGNNLIPPLMTGTPMGLAPSDNLFADIGTDHVPAVAIGRLPVLTADELQGAIAKIKSYEKTHGNQILLLADNPDGAGDFPADSDGIASLVPLTYSVQEIYLSNDQIDTARQLLTDSITKGVVLVNYTGHGGVGQLAQQGLLLNSDVDAMNNQMPPVMLAMTCLVGNFGIPGYDSLSEALVVKKGGGVSAIWAPTGMSFDSLSKVLDQNFFTAAFGSHEEILGDLILKSFQGYKSSGGPTYIIDIYNLQGDPAMKIW